MRAARPFFRAARKALILAALCTTGAHADGVIIVDDAEAPAKKDAAPAKTPLSPPLEAKLKEFTDKASVEVGKVWAARMKEEIENIAKATGLNDEGQKALEPAAKQAIDASVADWSDKMGNLLRLELAQQPAQAVRMLDQMLAQISQVAISSTMDLGFGGNVTQPFNQDAWIKGVHQVLDPTQTAAWDKVMSDRKDVKEKMIAGALKNGLDRTRQQQTQEVTTLCKQIELALALPQDRADKLDALGKSVVDLTVEKWRKRVEGMLLSMNDDQLRQITANGNVYFGVEATESPDKLPAWKEGLAGILTADEMARLQNTADARKAKRVHVMGQVMLMMLDEKIAFTAAQRQQLQSIADRLVKDIPQLYPDNQINSNFAAPPTVFYSAAAKATEAELKPVLDEIQRQRWKHLSDGGVPIGDDGDDDADGPVADAKPDEKVAPEDIEKLTSTFLYERTESERKSSLATATLTAEDAVRVAGLGGETAARLQVAARGTVEQSLSNWKWTMEQQARAQLQGATPLDIKQRLAGMAGQGMPGAQGIFFGGGIRMINGQMNGQAAPHLTILEKALQTDLTAPQQAAWKKETDAREDYRDKAVAALIMAEFDRKTQLSADQWAKLEPVISGLVHDYAPDIPRMFGGMNQVPWYMMGGGWALMPFAGIPEADLKAILTKEQWDLWNGCPEYTNATNVWQNVKQFHDQRVKTK